MWEGKGRKNGRYNIIMRAQDNSQSKLTTIQNTVIKTFTRITKWKKNCERVYVLIDLVRKAQSF